MKDQNTKETKSDYSPTLYRELELFWQDRWRRRIQTVKKKPYDPKHSPYGTEKVEIEIKNTKTHKHRYKHTRNKAQPGWLQKESRETEKAPKHKHSLDGAARNGLVASSTSRQWFLLRLVAHNPSNGWHYPLLLLICLTVFFTNCICWLRPLQKIPNIIDNITIPDTRKKII